MSAASSAPISVTYPLRVSGAEPVPWKWAHSPGLPINLASESHKVGSVPSQGARSTREASWPNSVSMVRKILAPPFGSCEKGSQTALRVTALRGPRHLHMWRGRQGAALGLSVYTPSEHFWSTYYVSSGLPGSEKHKKNNTCPPAHLLVGRGLMKRILLGEWRVIW